jgi:23S rRNA (pseudouridine1915-N3)-methyltransferase
MKITVCAVGRLKAQSAERVLTDDYMSRFYQTGRPHGWGPVSEIEIEDRKGGGMATEAILLRKSVPKGAVLITMDERGSVLTSPNFSKKLEHWADQGRDIAFVIGGADGIDPNLQAEADFSISFGAMVWPHKLVRVMLAEQLYRAASIRAGTPYHRV